MPAGPCGTVAAPDEKGTHWSRSDHSYRVVCGHKRGEFYVNLLGPLNPGKRWALLGIVVAMFALPGMASAKSPSKSKAKPVGRVYTETNSPVGNKILIFNRFANGHLSYVKAVATGGKGGQQLQPGCEPTCPFLDTQGEVALTSDGRLLFAVNAGSNTISSFRVTAGGLKLASVKSSGGKFPNSITTHGNVLYVLDSGIFPMPGPPVPGNIAGFRFNSAGRLTAIKGSIQPLTATVPGLARQVGFNNTGRVLVASLLGNPTLATPTGADSIDTFKVNASGVAGPATAYDATTPFPFGFAFAPAGQLIMSQVTSLTVPGAGDTASYKVSGSGALTPITTQATNGTAPCWVTITPSGRFAYVVNTGGGAPTGAFTSEYKLSPSGGLTLLGNTSVRPNEFALTDETLSSDGRYLYVLSTGASPATHHIDEYKVGGNGILTFIGQTPALSVPGASGLAGT
jgi:6-phosphogluconolactonase